jgi:hypothetical protein
MANLHVRPLALSPILKIDEADCDGNRIFRVPRIAKWSSDLPARTKCHFLLHLFNCCLNN